MLTKKQHELLLYINQRLAATGVAPSFDEMKDALNLRSKSGRRRSTLPASHGLRQRSTGKFRRRSCVGARATP